MWRTFGKESLLVANIKCEGMVVVVGIFCTSYFYILVKNLKTASKLACQKKNNQIFVSWLTRCWYNFRNPQAHSARQSSALETQPGPPDSAQYRRCSFSPDRAHTARGTAGSVYWIAGPTFLASAAAGHLSRGSRHTDLPAGDVAAGISAPRHPGTSHFRQDPSVRPATPHTI